MKKYLLLIFIIFIFTFNIRVSASNEATELYSLDFTKDILKNNGNGINVGNSAWKACTDNVCKKEIIDNYITSNNDRISSFLWYAMDNETNTYKSCISWQNYYPDSSSVINSTDKRALVQDEYLTLTISNNKDGTPLNINTSGYTDIRLNIEYFYLGGALTSFSSNGQMQVYIIDSENNEYGPYIAENYEIMGYYKENGKEHYVRLYNLITQNIKPNKNIIIKKVKIIPFGNGPKKNSFNGSWRQQGTRFLFSGVKIKGYHEAYSHTSIKNIDVNETRLNIAKRIYDMSTIKWTPEKSFSSTWAVGVLTIGDNGYTENEWYYGPPYTQINRVPIEKFKDELTSGLVLPSRTDNGSNTQSINVLGNDCATLVSYPLSKYLPFDGSYGTAEPLFDRNKTTLLGNLKIDGRKGTSKSIYDDLYEKYINQIEKGTISQSIKTNYEKAVNQRIKSNDLRMFLLKVIGDNDNKYYNYFAYSNTQSSDAIAAEENGLKIKVDNLSISAGKQVEISFDYLRYDANVMNDGSQYSDPEVSTNYSNTEHNIKMNVCYSNETCTDISNINISSPTEIYTNNDGKRVNMFKVTGTITSTNNITSIQIMPHGNRFTRLLFRLYDLEIKVSNSRYYYMSASQMATYFNLSDNAKSNQINNEYVSKINSSSNDFNETFASFLAKQDIYKGYSELTVGDIVTTYNGYNRLGSEWDISPDKKIAQKTLIRREKYGELPEVSRDGYRFLGWYTAKTGGVQVTPETIVNATSNYTMYAHWETEKKYVISANANGGTLYNTAGWTKNNNLLVRTMTVGKKYGILPRPVKTGYIFDGWNTKSDGTGTTVTEETIVNATSNYTMYAMWRNSNNIKVTLNSNGADAWTSTTCPSSKFTLNSLNCTKMVTLNSAYGDLPTPTRSGYTFEGWYTAKTEGTKVTATSTVSNTNDHVLYAHWNESGEKQKFIAEANDGKIGSSNGWVNSYDHKSASKELIIGSKFGVIPTPTRDGYRFVGWYTAQIGGTKIEENTIVTKLDNNTIYAIWESATSYTISANANGGRLADPTYSGGSAHVQLVTGNTKVVCLNGDVLTVSNNSIDIPHGNCDDKGGINGVESYFIRTDIKGSPASNSYYNRNEYGGLINDDDFVASSRWTPNSQYTDISGLSALAGKNMNAHIDAKHTFADSSNLGASVPVMYIPVRFNDLISGKVEEPFVKYINGNTSDNVKNGFKGTIYSNYNISSINFKISSSKGEYNKKVYPEYKYDLTGGYDSAGRPNYTAGEAKESAGTQNSYSLYYHTPDEVKNKLTELISDANSYEVTLTVNAGPSAEPMKVFSIKSYTITADANEGTIPSTTGWTLGSNGTTASKPIVYGETYGTLPTPTRSGYNFEGWYTAKTGGKEVTPDTIVQATQSYTMYARWAEKADVIFDEQYSTVDDTNNMLRNISVNTKVEDLFNSTINNETLKIYSKTGSLLYSLSNHDSTIVLATGQYVEFENSNGETERYAISVRGDTNGDGRLSFVDYVNVYNHIKKVMHPELTNKTLLVNEYLYAAEMTSNTTININFADYVAIYNKIKNHS